MLARFELSEFDEDVRLWNEALSAMKGYARAEIPLCWHHPATSREQFKFIFEWAVQGYLARLINIAEAYEDALNRRDVLAATILGKALVETVAHLRAMVRGIGKHLDKQEYPQAYYLAASFIGSGGKKNPVREGQTLKKLHILDSIRDDDSEYRQIFEGIYDWLNEFAHPNSLGTTVGFARPDKAKGVVKITQRLPMDKTALSTALEASIVLPMVVEELKIAEKIVERIMNEWKPSIEVCDLFEGLASKQPPKKGL